MSAIENNDKFSAMRIYRTLAQERGVPYEEWSRVMVTSTLNELKRKIKEMNYGNGRLRKKLDN